jgi:hypothetical protein
MKEHPKTAASTWQLHYELVSSLARCALVSMACLGVRLAEKEDTSQACSRADRRRQLMVKSDLSCHDTSVEDEHAGLVMDHDCESCSDFRVYHEPYASQN